MAMNSNMIVFAVLCSVLPLTGCEDTTSAKSAPPSESESALSSIQKETEQGKAEAECDRLAASPDDPARKAKGVQFKDIDAAAAIDACRHAVRLNPTPRMQFQYGRSLDKAEQYSDAVKWYRKGAEQGHATAQYNLGILYYNGQGVPQDYAAARNWYLESADQGSASAQYNLANMYANGQGGSQDYAAAREWYFKAAIQGDAEAQLNLGLLYANGQGGWKDPQRAYALFDVAATQGNITARNNRDIMHGMLLAARSLGEARELSKQYHNNLSAISEPTSESQPTSSSIRKEKELRDQGNGAQAPFDISSVHLARPAFAQYLINDQHERVQVQGLAAIYYGYGAYMRSFDMCPTLRKRSPASLDNLSKFAREKGMRQLIEKLDKLDKAANASAFIEGTLDLDLLIIESIAAIGSGTRDADTLISTLGCRAPETIRFTWAAEKLAQALFSIRMRNGGRPYERPAILAGLPEDTQRLYDEYYLCRVRTKTFSMVPGGVTDPCDAAWFQFKVSEAQAKGQPIPVRDRVRPWQSSQGVAGEYGETSMGIEIAFRAAPEDFTPQIPDSLRAKAGTVCVDCGAIKGWIIGPNIYFYLTCNDGRANKLIRVSLTNRISVYGRGPLKFRGRERELIREDFTELRHLGSERAVLECRYYADNRLLNTLYYWYKSRPALADPARLKARVSNHPLLLILGAREDCPATLADEITEIRRMLLR